MGEIYMNRELSWLKFNERVLEEAENESVPLCERMTFVSIFESNLDEFFMVRVGSLRDQMLISSKWKDNKTNMTAQEQIHAIFREVKKLNKRKDKIYSKLMTEVEQFGICLIDFQMAREEEQQYLEKYFETEIAPLISPTVVGKRQPFPFLRNKEIYAVVVLETRNGKERLGIIPCTNNMLERMIELPFGQGRYMLSEDLILHFMAKVFKGYKIKGKSLIRVIRNADIDADALYDEDLDYREFMAELMKERKKLSPVRLSLSREMDGNVVHALCKYLDMDTDSVFREESPLDMTFISEIEDLLRKNSEMFYEKRVPQKTPDIKDGTSIIEQIKEEDKMLSYPYESIRPFLNLLVEAAEDENVVSIKMTLYRLAKQSKIIEALCEAAENGKEVVVLVELRARFDEENNIEWSRMLEKAGCQVIYGLENYKVHSKLCLITRKTEDGFSYITQIGTGNYNEKTARLYTDLSLITAKQSIGAETAMVFTALQKGEIVEKVKELLVAPACLQNRIIDMIDYEIEKVKNKKDGYIGLKFNSLTDKTLIEKLIEASQVGVKIELIIRGICCLKPGIAGITENIRVISIVGRYLEHSRIYIFGQKDDEKIYISSADLMTRNTLRRVEVAVPIYDEDIKHRIRNMFDIMMRDDKKGKEQNSSGIYCERLINTPKIDSQEYFYQEAYKKETNM